MWHSWLGPLDVTVFFSLVHLHCEGGSVGGGGDGPSYPEPLLQKGVGGQSGPAKTWCLVLGVKKDSAD